MKVNTAEAASVGSGPLQTWRGRRPAMMDNAFRT